MQLSINTGKDNKPNSGAKATGAPPLINISLLTREDLTWARYAANDVLKEKQKVQALVYWLTMSLFDKRNAVSV